MPWKRVHYVRFQSRIDTTLYADETNASGSGHYLTITIANDDRDRKLATRERKRARDKSRISSRPTQNRECKPRMQRLSIIFIRITELEREA